MKILVVGGAGYIGSHVVYELIRQKFEVIVLDNLATGHLNAIHSRAKFYEGNQCDEKLLGQIFTENKIDVVMHFAAKLIVSESVHKPIEYFENNVGGVIALLKVMKQFAVKNLIFSSTAAVYGEPQRVPIDEDDVKKPINPYGSSKLACEFLIEGAHHATDLNYAIFRYFNVAGADASGQIGLNSENLTHLIPIVIATALGQREQITVYGNDYDTLDGTCIRDYIHISDLVRAHILGIDYVVANKSNTFNLGSNRGYSVSEVIETARQVLKNPIRAIIVPRRSVDPAVLIASTTRAALELNFKPQKSLAQMIQSDYDWRQKLMLIAKEQNEN